jgi:hypothetical protein
MLQQMELPLNKYNPGLSCVVEETEHVMELPQLVVVKGLHINDKEFYQLQVGDNLAAKLMEFGPDRWGGSGIRLFRNCLKKENQIDLLTVPKIIVQKDDLFIAYVGAADPITASILGAVLIGAVVGLSTTAAIGIAIGVMVIAGAVVGSLLLKVPEVKSPEVSSDNSAAQTGTLGIPQNRARLGSRIPEIFGYVRTWPDLITNPIDIYSGKRYTLAIDYCLGIGDYEIGQPCFGDVPTSKFPGTTITVFKPGDVPFPQGVMKVTTEGDGIQLKKGIWTAWFLMPGTNVTELWVDFLFPGGLHRFSSSSGDIVDEWCQGRIEYQQWTGTAPTGPVFSQPWYYETATTGQLRFTRRITVGPATWRVRVIKDDFFHSLNDIVTHDVEIARLATYKIVTVSHARYQRPRTYLRVHVNTYRTALAQNYDKFNCIANRYLPYVRRGEIIDPSLENRWVDALVNMCMDSYVGRYAYAALDTDTMLDVQFKMDAQDSGTQGKFNWIFDRFMDVDNQLQAVANAARCQVISDFGVLTVIRDERKTGRTALFTNRNRVEGDEGGKTLSFPMPDDPDGVEIEWFDVDNKYVKRTFRYPDTTQIFNPRKVEVVGLHFWTQVYRRAVFEYWKQERRRRTNSLVTLEEGLLLQPLDLVEVVEPYIAWHTQGEVIGYDLTASPRPWIDVEPGVIVQPNDEIILTKFDGRQTDQIIVAAATATGVVVDRVYLNRAPVFTPIIYSEAGAPLEGKYQAPSRFYLGSVTEHIRNLWLVSSVKPEKEKVQVQLLEYADTIYDAYTIGVPAPPPLPQE